MWNDEPLEYDGLPPIISEFDLDNRPPLAPELIEGVLRKGHKMIIAGPSKAGKSFMLIELALCIATGRDWYGMPCRQGKVLYINLEIDRASFWHRVFDVAAALEIDRPENICVWNLRGYARPLERLADTMIARYRNYGFTTIILDPIYKVNTHNENSAYEISQLCNQFDRICTEMGCALIYCHHHSKGNQGWKRSIDRASGSGVFARDADAILDVIELELPPERREVDITAWRIEGTLREFQKFDPVDVWFNHPIHTVVKFRPDEFIAPHNELPSWKRAMNGRATKEEKLRKRQHRLEAAFDICSGKGPVMISTLAEYLNVSTRSIRNYIEEHPAFQCVNGEVERIKCE